MFKFFANLFGYLLNAIYGFIGNYGITIIIFTVLVKLAMLPFSVKQQKTMKKTTEIQMKAKEIQEKYSNDQVRQSQELMDLYKRENMSPFAGCFSSILQIILILSVFYLVSSPLTYMKKVDQSVITSYVKEIEESKSEKLSYPEIAVIKEMGAKDEKVNLNMDFFGLDLSDIPSKDYEDWKVFIIPVLYVVTSLISMKLTMPATPTVEAEDKNKTKEENNNENNNNQDVDMMQEMNGQMRIMMPIMTVMIACIAPLGLALYWLVSNLLTLVERLFIKRFFKEEDEEVNG